jgi:hypothetical protein
MIDRVIEFKHSKERCRYRLEISYLMIKREKQLADPFICNLMSLKLTTA